MLNRAEKSFLTVETGEAYQPIRLVYNVLDKAALLTILNGLHCLEKGTSAGSWSWHWKEECNDLHFESINTFAKNSDNSLRLGTLVLRDDRLVLNLPSFKRACLAVSFFHTAISSKVACIHHADFINKVFALDERLPQGFSVLFKEEDLEKILQQRITGYKKIKEKCEHADSAEEAFTILSDYTKAEAKKRLPYAERFNFKLQEQDDPEVIFLSFYVFLRSRELVAIRRWYGEPSFNLADVADEAVEKVFGGVGIDLIE